MFVASLKKLPLGTYHFTTYKQTKMASFKAKIEARRLLKSLAVGTTPQKAHSVETVKSFNEREKIHHGDDVLRKKYEELGRLLALQHLEQNVVSSIDSMDIHMSSKGHPSKASKRQSRSCTKSKGKTSRKPANQNDISKSPGYVFVEIPQAYNSEKLNESDGHEMQINLTNERRRTRPRSARVEPAQKSKMPSRRSTRRNAKRHSNNISQLRFAPTESIYKESGSDYFAPHDEYSYRGGHGDGMFHPREATNAELFDVPEGGEEIVFEEVNEEPVFIIQGEVEITESVSYNIETEKVSDDNKTFVNDKQLPERSKRVSFLLENSDKEPEKRSSFSEVPGDENRTFVNQNKLEDTPLHIVLEEEILNELLHSPRPGLYQKNDNSVDKKQTRCPRKKKKTKASKNVKNYTENSKSGVKIGNSDKSENRTTSDVTSPRVTPRTPRTSTKPGASDHKLETTENPAIKLWLKKKNKLIRQQKREERKKEKSKQLAEENEFRERMEKLVQSEKLVNEWEGKKRRERKEKAAAERKVKRVMREAAPRIAEKQDKDGAKLGEGERKNAARSSVVKGKKTVRLKKKSKVHPGGENVSENESLDKKMTIQKKVSYEEWLKQKRARDRKIRLQKEKLANDPELDGIIPSLGRQRIQNATKRRGKRLPEKEDSVVRSDLPESDQRFENPFKLPSDEEMCKSFGSAKSRPSSAKPRSSTSSFKTKRDEPDRLETLRAFQDLSQCYAWDEDKNTDKGYETLSSDNSNASVRTQSKSNQRSESRDEPDEEENDEGIFLTEPLP